MVAERRPDMEQENEIVVSRVIDAPRTVIFDAFTSLEHLDGWWAPPGSTMRTRSFDLRPGGVWDATIEDARGGSYPSYIVWREVQRPERLVWSFGMSKDDPRPVLTTLVLTERGATTEVTLRLGFGSKEERDQRAAHYAAQGAAQSLDRAAAYVSAKTGAQEVSRHHG